MKLLEGLRSYLRNYPYHRRLPLVGVYLLIRAFDHQPEMLRSPYGWVTDGTLILALLTSAKGRPFWLLIGIYLGQIIGIIMMALFSPSLPR
jgi:hypothetical protein